MLRGKYAKAFVAIGIGPVSGLLVYWIGRSMDCSPGQSDGQCGLSTFMGIVGGVFVGGMISLASLIVTARVAPPDQ